MESPYFPFCSERCKLIDLGAWALEKYKVPAQDLDDQVDQSEKPETEE